MSEEEVVEDSPRSKALAKKGKKKKGKKKVSSAKPNLAKPSAKKKSSSKKKTSTKKKSSTKKKAKSNGKAKSAKGGYPPFHEKKNIGNYAKHLILTGRDSEKVISMVKTKFPDSNISSAHIAHYRLALRKEGYSI